jgi:hypothetical protein
VFPYGVLARGRGKKRRGGLVGRLCDFVGGERC